MTDTPVPTLHPDAVYSVNKLMAQFDTEDLKLRDLLRQWLAVANSGNPPPDYLIGRTQLALQSRPMRMPMTISPGGMPSDDPVSSPTPTI